MKGHGRNVRITIIIVIIRSVILGRSSGLVAIAISEVFAQNTHHFVRPILVSVKTKSIISIMSTDRMRSGAS